MTTVEINERTKTGKALLEVLKNFSKEKKVVKIIEPKKKPKEYPISKNVPNAKTLRSMEKTSKGIGLSKPRSVKEFLKEIDSW